MSQTLASLISRLQADVPARDGVPSAAQYEQAVKDAAADFSRRASMRKIATLSIVAGTATYALPADFVKLVKLESLTSPDGIIQSAQGLIPVSATFREEYTIAGGQITFYPTPAYSLARDLVYGAGHVLSGSPGSEVYADMTDDVAEIVMLKAQVFALRRQANKVAHDAWQYQIGDERVSKEKLAGELRAQADSLDREYAEAVRAHKGQIALRALYV